jgi:hypothetical protein
MFILSGILDGRYSSPLRLYHPWVCLGTSLVVNHPMSPQHCLRTLGRRLQTMHTSRVWLQWVVVKRTWQLCLRGFSPIMARQLITKTWVIVPSCICEYSNSFAQWIYLSDDHLYATRWESLIDIRDKVDIVQVISWNDFGESHYIGPIEGDQPMSQAWVDGNDHTGAHLLVIYANEPMLTYLHQAGSL